MEYMMFLKEAIGGFLCNRKTDEMKSSSLNFFTIDHN